MMIIILYLKKLYYRIFFKIYLAALKLHDLCMSDFVFCSMSVCVPLEGLVWPTKHLFKPTGLYSRV